MSVPMLRDALGPFADIWLKFGRADDHLQTLKASLLAMIDGDANTGVQINTDAEQRTWAAVVNLPGAVRIDPEWSLLIGEILYHLRSILDHLINAIVPVQTVHTSFPIRDSEESFDNDAARQLEGIKPGSIDWTVTKLLQPFSLKPKSPRDSTPWALNELARLDRHRFIHTSGIWLTDAHLNIDPPGRATIDYSIEVPTPFEDGAILASGRLIDADETEVTMEFVGVPDLVLTSLEGFRGTSDLRGLSVSGLEHAMFFIAAVIRAYEDPFAFLQVEDNGFAQNS